MATKAYVLIDTGVGRSRAVAQGVLKVAGATEAYAVAGPHDVIAIVEGATLTDVSNIVTSGIHHVPGVTPTLTCVAINP